MKKLLLLIIFALSLTSCRENTPVQSTLEETKTFILGEKEEQLISFEEFEDGTPYVDHIYNFIEPISNNDDLYFEHHISTLDSNVARLEPNKNEKCKTQIIKYNKKTKEKEVILTSPNIPVFTFDTIAPYHDGYCTGEISANSSGDSFNSIISQYNIESKSYNYYPLNSEEMPTVCGFDENNILALSFRTWKNHTESIITLINTDKKETKNILSKTMHNTEKTYSGTFINDISSAAKTVVSLETDENTESAKTFIRIYNLEGALLQEYKLDTDKIGYPSCVGNGDLCINNKHISIKTNYGYYILSPNEQPFKINSVNNDSKHLFFAGESEDYFVYYEENYNNNKEIVFHVVDTKTHIDNLYYLGYADTPYTPITMNITTDNDLVVCMKNVDEHSSNENIYYYIEDFI